MPFRDAFAAATAKSPRHCGDSARDGNKHGVPLRGVSGLSFYVGLQRRDVFGEGIAPGVVMRQTVQGIFPRKVFSISI